MKHSVDIDSLAKRYRDGLTTRQIAAETGIPPRTVTRYLHKAGAELRNPGAPHVKQLLNTEWLAREYLDCMRSTTDIASELGCAATIVSRHLKRSGIIARGTGSTKGHSRNDSQECREKMSAAKREIFLGSANPNWKGGIVWKDPDRNRYPSKMWVKAVKDRDGRACTECGSTEKLHAHHIKRWKDYPSLRYEVSNGVTLCHTCHEAAHGRGFKFRWRKVRIKLHECAAPMGDDIVRA